jgi:hypothetical protein
LLDLVYRQFLKITRRYSPLLNSHRSKLVLYDAPVVVKLSARKPRIGGGGDPADSVCVLIEMFG